MSEVKFLPAIGELLGAVVQERDDLRAKPAEAEADARRYRWLRDKNPQSDVCGTDDRREFDSRIDAALAREQQEQPK